MHGLEFQDVNRTDDLKARILTAAAIAITAMLMQGLSDPRSREIADRVWRDGMIAPLADWLGEPDAVGRARNLYALMAGFTLLAHDPDQAASSPEALAWQAAALQSIVDGTRLGD